MKNSISKPYEGKLHIRFDEEGTDSLTIFTIFVMLIVGLSGFTLSGNFNNSFELIK